MCTIFILMAILPRGYYYLYRWSNRGPERFRNLSMITELRSNRARICQARKPDRAHALNICWETLHTFLNFAEADACLAWRKDLLPPGPGWRSSVETTCNWPAEKQTSIPLALLNLGCLLSGLWQKKTQTRSEFTLFSPLMLPKGKPMQKLPFEAVFYMKK